MLITITMLLMKLVDREAPIFFAGTLMFFSHHVVHLTVPCDLTTIFAVANFNSFVFTAILLNMDCNVYWLKIKYDNTIGKFGIVFIDWKEAASLNREVILEKVCSITSRFDNTKEGDINIQYLDNEKNFVSLTEDQSCIWDLLCCAVPVSNADFKHINL